MGRRKKELPSAHREAISSAASLLFEKKGVSATTVDEIARAAGYGKATLYVYFQNKEEIYFYLVYQHMLELCCTLERISSEEARTRKAWNRSYLRMCHAILALCREHPFYFEGMIGDIPVDADDTSSPGIYRDIYKAGLRLTETVSIMMRKGSDLGIVGAQNGADRVAAYFWSAITGIVRMAESKRAYYELLGLDEGFLDRAFIDLVYGLNGCEEVPSC